jgi:CRISPR/Cas system-associated endoribonuclease Cas2
MLQVVEPPQNEYERSRDRQVAANNKKMQALGLKVLASVFNKSVPPSESSTIKETRKQIVMIQSHQIIILRMMIKDVLLMMTLNYLMGPQWPWKLRCYLYLQCCVC